MQNARIDAGEQLVECVSSALGTMMSDMTISFDSKASKATPPHTNLDKSVDLFTFFGPGEGVPSQPGEAEIESAESLFMSTNDMVPSSTPMRPSAPANETELEVSIIILQIGSPVRKEEAPQNPFLVGISCPVVEDEQEVWSTQLTYRALTLVPAFC